MTTASEAYDAATDPDVPDDELDTDELARRRASNPTNAARRAESKRIRDLETENADLKGKVTGFERRDALDKARSDLNAEGPLGAFLRTYDGEPTADAIKAAVEADPDFKGLITFTLDERDAAAAEQADNAKKLSGGVSAAMTEITPDQARGWDPQRINQFRTTHPDEWNKLLAGQTVPVPAAAVTT